MKSWVVKFCTVLVAITGLDTSLHSDAFAKSGKEPFRAACRKAFQLSAEDGRILKRADEYGFEAKHTQDVKNYNKDYDATKKEADKQHCWVYTPAGQIAHHIFTL